MTDITKITTPFGLLDKATQDELKAAYEVGFTIDVYTPSGWKSPAPHWNTNTVYRVKPVPVRVSFRWAFYENDDRILLGRHHITCLEDGTNPTVTWEPSE